uniref:Translocase of outer mitochondrial membrane 20 n=1 Tax=Naja naja TaxID=35670 RepID=A0A8C6VEX2_NAJNA
MTEVPALGGPSFSLRAWPRCLGEPRGRRERQKMMGGKSSAIAAGVCGALFIGYCIYFDRKRRSDPNFKNRLREREYEKGVDHLTNAIAVCGQPQQLLQVLQQTLPPPVFQMLLTKLPTISQRIVSAQCLAEDDVE